MLLHPVSLFDLFAQPPTQWKPEQIMFNSFVSQDSDGIFCVAVIGVFFAWFNTLLRMRKVPFFGIYLIMFTKILRNSIVAILIFTPLLLAFSFSFSLLLGNMVRIVYKQYSGNSLQTAMETLQNTLRLTRQETTQSLSNIRKVP